MTLFALILCVAAAAQVVCGVVAVVAISKAQRALTHAANQRQRHDELLLAEMQRIKQLAERRLAAFDDPVTLETR